MAQNENKSVLVSSKVKGHARIIFGRITISFAKPFEHKVSYELLPWNIRLKWKTLLPTSKAKSNRKRAYVKYGQARHHPSGILWPVRTMGGSPSKAAADGTGAEGWENSDRD